MSRFSEAHEARLEARFAAAASAYDAAYETPMEDAAFAAMQRADKACVAWRDAEQGRGTARDSLRQSRRGRSNRAW